MSKPKPKPAHRIVSARLSLATIAELDRIAVNMAEETPGLQLSRSDVIRIALETYARGF